MCVGRYMIFIGSIAKKEVTKERYQMWNKSG